MMFQLVPLRPTFRRRQAISIVEVSRKQTLVEDSWKNWCLSGRSFLSCIPQNIMVRDDTKNQSKQDKDTLRQSSVTSEMLIVSVSLEKAP